MIGHSRVYPSLLREEKDQAQKSSEVNKLYRKKKRKKRRRVSKREEGYPGHPHSTWGKFFLPQSVTQEVFHMYLYNYIHLYNIIFSLDKN